MTCPRRGERSGGVRRRGRAPGADGEARGKGRGRVRRRGHARAWASSGADAEASAQMEGGGGGRRGVARRPGRAVGRGVQAGEGGGGAGRRRADRGGGAARGEVREDRVSSFGRWRNPGIPGGWVLVRAAGGVLSCVAERAPWPAVPHPGGSQALERDTASLGPPSDVPGDRRAAGGARTDVETAAGGKGGGFSNFLQ